MKKLTGRLLAFMALAGLFVFTGCGDDDEVVPTQTVWEILEADSGGNSGLDSLAKYLSVYPDLVGLLQSPGERTVFAPTNAAFISLLQTPGFPPNITDINPEIIKGVLSYHIIEGQTLLSGELTAGSSFNTVLPNEVITINADGTLLTGSSNNAIAITQADILATNGVVHKVGSVLIPPSVGETLTPILGTLAGTVLLGADFSHLADFVSRADEQVPSGESSIAEILASSGPFTAFLVPNQVFEGAAEAQGITVEQFINSFEPASARGVLATHITADGAVASGDLTNGQTFTALSQVTLTITVEDTPTTSPTGVLVSAPGNSSPVPVVRADINHSNGIGHVIGGILLPQ